MSPPGRKCREDRSAVPLARVTGSAFAGVVELFGFHPVDTVAKRLMNSPDTIRTRGVSTTMAMEGYSRIIFREAHGAGAFRKYTSLFPGLSFAAGYKILQRVYKFGGQPFVREMMERRFGSQIENLVGGDKGKAKMWVHAISGAAVGVGEIALLPLDVLKIKSQNNPEALRGRGLLTILREERISGLYRGAGWTAARNAPGSFALFGASAFVKERVFGLKNFNDATFAQNFVASAAGGIASITVASPLDVVKTRLQTRDFGSGESGSKILRDLLAKEGPSALFKGLVPKLLVVGPKLVFSFTIAQHMISVFEQSMNGRPA
ncbi:mitochondrial carrier protein [Gracilaria domingensis]|nr:mitochondrial carrier protein [Gracilaria domingensis]